MEKIMLLSANNLILYFIFYPFPVGQEQSLEGLLIQYLNNRDKNHLVPPVVFY